MPDLVLYQQAMLASAVVSAVCVLAIACRRQPVSPTRVSVSLVLGMGVGLLIGYRIMHLRLSWPPVKGLDRLLTIVLPAVIGIELIIAAARMPQWMAWFLRFSLAMATGRILLHDSVYLGESANAWNMLQAGGVLAISGAMLAVVWGLMSRLSVRPCGSSIPLALAMASQCAGMTIMLEGYVTGGAAAFPLAAVLVGTAAALTLLGNRAPVQGMTGIAVVCLFGLLFVGRFFGGLSTAVALTVFLAPVLCWATEIPVFRIRRTWILGWLRLVLVAIPLVIVLGFAKQTFDRETRPLLGLDRVDFSKADEQQNDFWLPSPRITRSMGRMKAIHL